MVIDIPYVEIETFFPGECVATVDLGPTGQAGEDVVATSLMGRVTREVLRKKRARANKTHVAPEDIEEFGQFIERSGAEPATERSKPFGIGKEVAGGVAEVAHRTEFDEGEELSVQAGASLSKENGRAEAEADEAGDENEERQP